MKIKKLTKKQNSTNKYNLSILVEPALTRNIIVEPALTLKSGMLSKVKMSVKSNSFFGYCPPERAELSGG